MTLEVEIKLILTGQSVLVCRHETTVCMKRSTLDRDLKVSQ